MSFLWKKQGARRMKTSRIHGWQAVYRFSLKQHLKGMPFQVMTTLVCVLLILVLPVVYWMTQTVEQTSVTNVKKLYIIDETGMNLDYLGFASGEYRELQIIQDTRNVQEVTEKLQKLSGKEKTALAQIRFQDGTLQVNMYYGVGSSLGEVDLSAMGNALLRYYRDQAVQQKTTGEQKEILERSVSVNTQKLRENMLPETTGRVNGIEYAVIMVISCLAMMFVAISGEGIASSIVTEKSSKITEYLLTSVKPLALIVGKVLSVLTAVFFQFVLMAASLAASWGIVRLMGDETLSLSAVLGGMTGDIQVQPLGVIGAVLFFALGLLLYGMMAGVVGASVSRVEETSEGLKFYNILLIGCSILGVTAARLGAAGEYRALVAVAVLCPFSSPFIVPAYLALGKLSAGMLICSVVLLILTVVAAAYFVAGVYETLIFYRGSHVKMKNLWKMVIGRRGER